MCVETGNPGGAAGKQRRSRRKPPQQLRLIWKGAARKGEKQVDEAGSHQWEGGHACLFSRVHEEATIAAWAGLELLCPSADSCSGEERGVHSGLKKKEWRSTEQHAYLQLFDILHVRIKGHVKSFSIK